MFLVKRDGFCEKTRPLDLPSLLLWSKNGTIKVCLLKFAQGSTANLLAVEEKFAQAKNNLGLGHRSVHVTPCRPFVFQLLFVPFTTCNDSDISFEQ